MIGIKVIAIKITPIPPSHCNIALHIRIPLGEFSILLKIVAPVVVIPDKLSKNESVIDKFNYEKKKGKDPKTAILNHDKAVNKKAC